MEKKTTFSFKWYQSLQFKMPAMFFIILLFIVFSVLMILKTFGNQLIEEQAYLQLDKAGNEVVAELKKNIVLSSTLVDAMANMAEKLPRDVDLYKTLTRQLLNYKGTEEFIAGGGIWPAPFQFDQNIERRSFFWGRDQNGRLEFYDDYNHPEADSYHQQEWYVPGTLLNEGDIYWSKSYTDPYSLQPMVTVTAPMINDSLTTGVATIDLRLEGLQQLLAKIAKPFQGYAFAIDRNGTFLSYPDIEQVISTTRNSQGQTLKSFIKYQALATKSPQFSELASELENGRNNLLRSVDAKNGLKDKLIDKLLTNSPHIAREEAGIIAASLLSSPKDNSNAIFKPRNFLLEHDPLLHEPVFISISMMPDTYWEIVTVMPYSKGIEKIAATYEQLMRATFAVVLFALFFSWLLIRRIITAPIHHLSKQIQSQFDGKVTDMRLLDTTTSGELRALTEVFNQRTGQLLTAQHEMTELAYFDAITGLPNRRLLIDRLNEKLAICKRQACHGALLYIDLDNFKLINDSLGHNMGDELLVQVAARFQQCLRREDTVARLGGDEFVVLVLLYNVDHAHLAREAMHIAQKLVDAIETPFELNKNQYQISCSIGITTFSQGDTSTDELLRQADTAMYRAKNKGKNGFCMFTPQMQAQADKRLHKLEPH